MIFTEPRFLLFFAVCFTVHWLLRNHRVQKLWLLGCSYFFYGCWDYRFLLMIFVMTAIDYAVAIKLADTESPRVRKAILCISLVMNFGFLGFFKYFNFFIESGASILTWAGVATQPRHFDIVLPVGISFITFQTLSYTIDVYRRELPPQRNFLDFATFVAFFPQLVAGPIVRAADFLPQLDRQPRFSDIEGRRWLLLFAAGFFKKACLADNIAQAIDPVFVDPAKYGGLDVALASILYSVQIYCDFSGYSDMALATAGMLGYRLTLNFDFPYFSRSIQEFWRRWHISLSTWLRDYLYVSLGGSRGGLFLTCRNLMLTMLLGGLWHGANVTFILWGALHGLALLVHRAFVAAKRRLGWAAAPATALGRAGGVAWSLLAWLMTLSWVVLCFTIFRAPSIGSFATLMHQLSDTTKVLRLNLDLWPLLALVGAVHFVLFKYGDALRSTGRRVPDAPFYVAYGAVAALLLYLMPFSAKPFIYFQF